MKIAMFLTSVVFSVLATTASANPANALGYGKGWVQDGNGWYSRYSQSTGLQSLYVSGKDHLFIQCGTEGTKQANIFKYKWKINGVKFDYSFNYRGRVSTYAENIHGMLPQIKVGKKVYNAPAYEEEMIEWGNAAFNQGVTLITPQGNLRIRPTTAQPIICGYGGD